MESFKFGFNLLGKYIVCILMSFFITLSFVAIFTMLDPPSMAGYEAAVFETKESQTPIESYVHYYSDGEDAKKTAYEADGYTVAIREFPGKLTGTPNIVCYTIVQIISLILFVFIVPYGLKKRGSVDASNIARGYGKEDLLSGLKSGIVPASLSFITWICLVLGKMGVISGGKFIYEIGNYYLFGYQKLIFSEATTAVEISWLGIGLALLPVILILGVCAVTYIMGYKNINLYEKTVYKNN